MNRQRGNILKMTIDRRRRKCDEGCTGFVFFFKSGRGRICNFKSTHIGGQVATDLLYCTACRLELWDSDVVFITQN